MQAISNALNRLHEDLAWFIRAKEVELLVIRTTGDLWSTVVRLLPMFEFDRRNASPWLLLEDAHTAADHGWAARAIRLHDHWELRRRAFLDREHLEMPAANDQIEPPPAGSDVPAPLARFESTLAGILRAQRAPLDGAFVIVFAPGVLDSVEALWAELSTMMVSPSLARARWILVLNESHAVPSLTCRMGPRAIVCDCLVDPDEQGKDFAAIIAGPDLGRAGPRDIEPPRRVDAPPEVDPEVRNSALRAAGINPAFLDQAPVLSRLLFDAAISMKEGRGDDAIAAQRRASVLAAALGMHELHVFCRIALASYLSGLDRRQAAVLELRSAVEHAERQQFGLVEAQARLALGLVFAIDRRYTDAAYQYAECARRAETANVPLIAIEGWRLAGQIALQLGNDARAAFCFREAIRIAEGSEVDIARASSAAEAARALAKRYQDRGMVAPAESLFQQADAIEEGEIGVPAAAAPQEELSHARQ